MNAAAVAVATGVQVTIKAIQKQTGAKELSLRDVPMDSFQVCQRTSQKGPPGGAHRCIALAQTPASLHAEPMPDTVASLNCWQQ